MFFGNFQMLTFSLPSALKKDAAKKMNQSWMIPSAVFILAIALQTKISLYSKFLRRFGSMPKTFNTCFVDLEKVYGPVLRNKLWRVLREYGVDDRLLLAVKSLYSCSEVCVRRIKSRPFTVGLRQWCVLSPLLFIVSRRQNYGSRAHPAPD